MSLFILWWLVIWNICICHYLYCGGWLYGIFAYVIIYIVVVGYTEYLHMSLFILWWLVIRNICICHYLYCGGWLYGIFAYVIIYIVVVGCTEYLHMSLFQAFLNTAALTGRLFWYVWVSFEFGIRNVKVLFTMWELFCEERLEIKENGDCSWTGSRKVCCFDDSKCGVYYCLKCNATKSGGNNQNVRHKFSENSNLQKVIMIEYLSGRVKR